MEEPITKYTKSERFAYEHVQVSGSSTINVRELQTHKLTKAGVTVDTERVVATFVITNPDEYQCSYLTVEFSRDFQKIEVDEMFSTIDMIVDSRTVFVRVPAAYMEDINSLSLILFEKHFLPMNNNSDFFECERPPRAWLPICMSLGMAVGVLLESTTKLFGLVGIAMIVGLLVGAIIDAKKHKRRTELKRARGSLKSGMTKADNLFIHSKSR